MNPVVFKYPETFKYGAIIGVLSGAALFSPWNIPILEWFFFCAFTLFGLVLSYNQTDPKADEGWRKVSAYFQGFFLFGLLVFALVSWSVGTFRSIAVVVLSAIVSLYLCEKASGKRTSKVQMLSPEEIKRSRAEFRVRLERIRKSSKRFDEEAKKGEELWHRFNESDDRPPPAA